MREKTVRKKETRALAVGAQSDIAARAYELFVQRGCQHGRDWDDWLAAERELAGVESLSDGEVILRPVAERRRKRASGAAI
jgi:hypothetical protein